MNYILKQFDEPLVKFSATTDTSEPAVSYTHLDVYKRQPIYRLSGA